MGNIAQGQRLRG